VFYDDYIYINLKISSIDLGTIPLYGSPAEYLKPSIV
jgi:hypothetical protein